MLNIEVGGAGGGYAFKVDDGGGGQLQKSAGQRVETRGDPYPPSPPYELTWGLSEMIMVWATEWTTAWKNPNGRK